jgi:hypothetical protein
MQRAICSQGGVLLLCWCVKRDACGFEGIQPIQQGPIIRPRGWHHGWERRNASMFTAAGKQAQNQHTVDLEGDLRE